MHDVQGRLGRRDVLRRILLGQHLVREELVSLPLVLLVHRAELGWLQSGRVRGWLHSEDVLFQRCVRNVPESTKVGCLLSYLLPGRIRGDLEILTA